MSLEEQLLNHIYLTLQVIVIVLIVIIIIVDDDDH